MPLSHLLRQVAAAGLCTTALSVVGLPAPAQARVADAGDACLTPRTNEATSAARGGPTGLDHRDISAAEQRAITRRTRSLLAARGATGRAPSGAPVGRTVPVHVHVMRSATGRGDVTNAQVYRQLAVLNSDFASAGFSFDLISTRRYANSAWHQEPAVRQVPLPDPPGRREGPQHLAGRHPVVRGRDLPLGLRREPRGRRHPGRLRLPARGEHHPLQRGPDGDPRDRSLARPVPHLPGRLHRVQRPDRRHPRPGHPDPRLPRRPGLVSAARRRPGAQLHGLQLRTAATPTSPRTRPRA